MLTSLATCVTLFSVMGHIKSAHIDWLTAQDDAVVAPVEGHDGYRVDSRELQEHDFASPVDEDCGWFGYEGLCED